MYGNPFTPYSKSYKNKRAKAGKRTDVVDLSWSNSVPFRMVSQHNIIHQVNGSYDTVVVFMKNKEKEQIAYYHQISGAGRKRVIRKFFGLSEIDVQDILKVVESKAEELAEATEKTIMKELQKLKTKLNRYTAEGLDFTNRINKV